MDPFLTYNAKTQQYNIHSKHFDKIKFHRQTNRHPTKTVTNNQLPVPKNQQLPPNFGKLL